MGTPLENWLAVAKRASVFMHARTAVPQAWRLRRDLGTRIDHVLGLILRHDPSLEAAMKIGWPTKEPRNPTPLVIKPQA